MRRLISNALMCWLLLLVPGATALELLRPDTLLPACCRTHGAHHCAMEMAGSPHHDHGPGWRGPGCPFTHLQHAALLLPAYLPATLPQLTRQEQTAIAAAAELSSLASLLAGLPGSRAPPQLL